MHDTEVSATLAARHRAGLPDDAHPSPLRDGRIACDKRQVEPERRRADQSIERIIVGTLLVGQKDRSGVRSND